MPLVQQRRRQSRRLAFRWITRALQWKSEVALTLLVACGGAAKQPAPIENQATRETAMGTSKEISRTNDGGVIELVGERNTALERANTEMAKHCGTDNYTITQEGEEAVDSDPCAIRPQTAWRIHYVCNNAN